MPSGLPGIQLELPTLGFLLRAVEPAIILALLGSVDSLLTSLVADSLTGTRHNPNRELVGQGIGNVIAGMFGGLPGAGATMGTVTNIHAGCDGTLRRGREDLANARCPAGFARRTGGEEQGRGTQGGDQVAGER